MLVGGWPYIAGFFDGEGCVRIYTRKSRTVAAQVKVTMVQTGDRGEAVLIKLSSFLSSQNINSKIYKTISKNPKHASFNQLVICRRNDVIGFLLGVMPYLTVKKVEAQDTLRFCKIFPLATRDSEVLSFLLSEGWWKRRKVAS